ASCVGDDRRPSSLGGLPQRTRRSAGPHPVRSRPSAVRGHPSLPRRQWADREATHHALPDRAWEALAALALHLLLPRATSLRVLRSSAAGEDTRRLGGLAPPVPHRRRAFGAGSVPSGSAPTGPPLAESRPPPRPSQSRALARRALRQSLHHGSP